MAPGWNAPLDEVDRIASGLYTLASMLIGEGEESVGLVEMVVDTADFSASDPTQASKKSRIALARAALEILERRSPGSLDSPVGLEPARTCIEDEDLDFVGASGERFSEMFAGPNRDHVRVWLASLPTAQRLIFVLRAIAGLTSNETAAVLSNHGGTKAAGWTADTVRELFRQAMCSLASQLIHSTAAQS